ncbi:MAG: hypothetical protein ACI9L9_001864 [Marivirga sp.]|jgi:hypothetical protein
MNDYQHKIFFKNLNVLSSFQQKLILDTFYTYYLNAKKENSLKEVTIEAIERGIQIKMKLFESQAYEAALIDYANQREHEIFEPSYRVEQKIVFSKTQDLEIHLKISEIANYFESIPFQYNVERLTPMDLSKLAFQRLLSGSSFHVRMKVKRTKIANSVGRIKLIFQTVSTAKPIEFDPEIVEIEWGRFIYVLSKYCGLRIFNVFK